MTKMGVPSEHRQTHTRQQGDGPSSAASERHQIDTFVATPQRARRRHAADHNVSDTRARMNNRGVTALLASIGMIIGVVVVPLSPFAPTAAHAATLPALTESDKYLLVSSRAGTDIAT